MADDVRVTGLKELQAFLDDLPQKMEKNIMRGALSAGARVIRDAAKVNAPVAPPNANNARKYGGYAGALRDSIRVSSRIKGGTVTASVKAGGKAGKSGRGADVFYAHMVEFGAAAHVITAKDGKALAFGGGVYKSVNHPGIKAKPFLRPALDGNAGAALVAVGEAIKKRLTKQGIDTSDVEIDEV
jgi:HK97 gp10 family phage protein